MSDILSPPAMTYLPHKGTSAFNYQKWIWQIRKQAFKTLVLYSRKCSEFARPSRYDVWIYPTASVTTHSIVITGTLSSGSF